MSKRTILAVISDTHGGHKQGLCNPGTILENIENGDRRLYSPQLSASQDWMWGVYEWGIGEVIALSGKDDIVLIHDGDPTHGKASFLSLMSSQLSDQLLIAQANFDRWMGYKNVKMFRLAVGTGIHELGEGSSSTLIANALSGKYPKVDIGVVYHGLLDIGGFLIDYAHHGPYIGKSKWVEGNELRNYLRSIMLSEIMEGHTPPHLIMRGHYHVYRREFLEVVSNGQSYGSWAVLLPGFTFKDDYTRRATKSEYKQTVGMMAFELLDGHLYDVHRFTKTVDIRTKESYGGARPELPDGRGHVLVAGNAAV